MVVGEGVGVDRCCCGGVWVGGAGGCFFFVFVGGCGGGVLFFCFGLGAGYEMLGCVCVCVWVV